MPKLIEMDPCVTMQDQLDGDEESIVLVNTFVVAKEDVEAFFSIWHSDASIMKAQPGFISTQLHQGIAGSGVFLNYAVWQSVGHFRAAFAKPEFQARLSEYPENITISPHLFRKIKVPGICVA